MFAHSVTLAADLMSNGTLKSMLDLLKQAVILAGGALMVFGGVTVGSNLKDHNGPAITGGLLELAGGALIAACGVFFTQLAG